jgi:hypothetical protein
MKGISIGQTPLLVKEADTEEKKSMKKFWITNFIPDDSNYAPVQKDESFNWHLRTNSQTMLE